MTIAEQSEEKPRWRLSIPRRLPPWISPVIALGLFGLAFKVIHDELSVHTFTDLSHALSGVAGLALLAAAAAAISSYACLIGGERIAMSLISKHVALIRVSRASFTAYALGNALGFSFATAPVVRARFYKNLLKPEDIAAVSALTGLSVFGSALAAAGIGLLVAAPEIATHFGHPVVWRLFGFVLIAPATAWIALSAGQRRSFSIGGVDIVAPKPANAALQCILGLGDWLGAAAVLFSLLPGHGGWSFPAFVAIFVASGLLGGISGVPGGLGVFEASILALAPETQHAPSAVAALVAYRLIYTLSPLALAAGFLAHDIASTAKTPMARVSRRVGGLAAELSPQVFSALAFAGGVVLLLSSATPAIASRLHFLSSVAPLFVIELSHFLASLTGVLLLVVAAALWRKFEGAYFATLALLTLGALFALLKGLDVEEAAILSVIGLTLLPCRSAFTRKSRLVNEALSPVWLMAVVGAFAAAGWLGFFAYRDVGYSDEMWWTFLRDADASRFLRAAAGTSVAIALVSMWSLLASPRSAWRGQPDQVSINRASAALNTAEGMRSDAHLALLADKDLLFSPSGKSFIMFRARNKHWIAMSEPCGLESERRELMWNFVELADEAGSSPAFYAVTEELLPEIADLGLAVRKIGEAAIVPLAKFSLEGKSRAGLRHAINRAEREGASFEILPPGSASAYASELKTVSDAWLSKHAGAEKTFSLGRFDVAYLDRTPLAIVRRDGSIAAFSNVWATPDKRELSIDLMRYGEHAPKNVMDYLFVRLMEWGKSQGYAEFDLGMAPMSGLDTHRLAPAISRIGAAMFEEGEALYGFRGLRSYKEKFDPEWRPLYLAARPGPMMAFALLHAALLTSGGWKGLFTKS